MLPSQMHLFLLRTLYNLAATEMRTPQDWFRERLEQAGGSVVG